MTIAPVRGLSKYGVITDVDPYSLPAEAFSMGVNVRFHSGSVLRAPVFRSAVTLTNSDPRFCTANDPNTGFSSVIVGYLNGKVTSISNGIETDISISGYTPTTSEALHTSTHLADVFYVNRGDRIPWSLRTSDTIMQPLANWNSTWRANILRSCGSALCAFGVTKSGAFFPTMVKTSEFALADTVPASWDETDPTTNATENVLAEMTSPITDAQTLGEIMIIYGLEETWTMVQDGSEEIWAYHKLYGNKGAINANCAVEVDKKHFVFGLDDIWVHDGVSQPASIADQRVKDFIFSNINLTKANRCFVNYNSRLKELYFHFVSADALCGFPAVDGCNRMAVYNIPEDNWTFYDEPYVFGACEANLDTVATWATVQGTWDTVGGSWLNQEDSLKRVVVMVGDTNATANVMKSLYAFDNQGPGSVVNFPVDQNATKGWTLIRDGIDLDELGADLKGYKLCSSIYPRARLEDNALPITFTFGAADFFNQEPSLVPSQSYDGNSLYRLDFNVAGRYLFMKATHNDYHYVNFTGLDLDLDVLGER